MCGGSSPLDSPPADLYSGLLVRTVLRNCAGGVLATEDSAHERGCSIVWTTSGSCPRSARLSYTTLLLSESAEAPCVLFSINCRGVLAPREEQLTESTDVQKRGADAVRAELLVQHMCVAQPTTCKRSTHTPARLYCQYRTLRANISGIWPAVPWRGWHLTAWRHCTQPTECPQQNESVTYSKCFILQL